MYTKVDSGAFTCLDNLFFHLLTHFGNHLFDACRVDTSVSNQLVQCQTGYFTANRVERRKNDSLGGIIYYDFNTGSSFESTDIAAFASDDASLDFVRFNVEYSY